MTDYDPSQGRPAIASWMARVRQETNPFYEQATVRVHKLAEKYKSKNLSVEEISKL